MSRRWSKKDNTKGDLSLISKPYILHKAFGGVTSSISVLFDLINVSFIVLLVRLSHNHRHAVITLIYVLKQILDGLDAPTCLNIDVAIEQT